MRKRRRDLLVPIDPEVKSQMLEAITRKDREHHRRNAEEYDRAVVSRYAMYHQWDLQPWVADVAKRHNGGLALDIGTGTGVVAWKLRECGFRVFAVDHSPEMRAIGRRRSAVSVRPVFYMRADVMHLPFGDNCFDVVTMQGILHHVPIAREDVVTEACRVLRPGGEFYISEPCADLSLVGRVLRFRWWFREYDPSGEQTDEEPIVWTELRAALWRADLKYNARFITHVPSANFHHWLPDRWRLRLTRVLSWPARRGDLVFVSGWKTMCGPK